MYFSTVKLELHLTIIQLHLTGTNHTSYCPMKLTNATYDVAVKAFNGSIIGDAARDFTTFKMCK